MTSVCHHIFVYGTLKSGQPNHYLIDNLVKSNLLKFVNRGILKEKRPLIIATEFNIPHLLDITGLGYNVIGEIYLYDNEDSLSTLDELEMHPDHYERKMCTVILRDKHERIEVDCWIYLLTNFKPEFLSYPHIEEYYDSIMGKVYVLPSKRIEKKFSLDLVKNI